MLIDTHCHMNMMVKKSFDTIMTKHEIEQTHDIISQATASGVTHIINVGTSLIESKNCITLAHQYPQVWAAVGIHPNDCTATWKEDLREIASLIRKEGIRKIVAIGECGLDFHYPDYNIQRQKDAFRTQIDLALENDLALIIHTRDAREETARIMEDYKGSVTRGIVHCFSEDLEFAKFSINLGYALGIGATITYPKNDRLRTVVTHVPLSSLVLETDAPFLPPQELRGKQNHPKYIPTIAQYIAHLRGGTLEEVADVTSQRAIDLFRIT